MKKSLLLVALLALSGCASQFETYYQPVHDAPLAPITGVQPTFYASTSDPVQDMNAMYTLGFGAVGYAAFTGQKADTDGALVQGAKVGATAVVVSAKYLNTTTGVIPITVPTTSTTYVSGTVRSTSSSRTATYSGTATTHGTQTSYVPYSVDRYDQMAIFFAPLPKKNLGVTVAALSDTDAQIAQTTVGARIVAVRRGSPMAMADIIPGDIILSISGTRYMMGDTDAIRQCYGKACDIVYLRNGQKRNVSILLGPNGEWQ